MAHDHLPAKFTETVTNMPIVPPTTSPIYLGSLEPNTTIPKINHLWVRVVGSAQAVLGEATHAGRHLAVFVPSYIHLSSKPGCWAIGSSEKRSKAIRARENLENLENSPYLRRRFGEIGVYEFAFE